MTGEVHEPGVWRISIRGTIKPSTAALLGDLRVVVVDAVTVVETGPVRPDTCTSTIAAFQSLGLDVIALRWLPEKAENG